MSKAIGNFPRKSILPDSNTPCPNTALAASTRNISNLSEAEYWAAIRPELTVSGKLKEAKPLKKPGLASEAKKQIHDEGVVQLGPEDLQWPVDVHLLARSMAVLMQYGWPPTFLMMYDEVWALIHRASKLMSSATGNACNMDILCWYVDPNCGDAGFSPHRDRQPEDSPATFRPDDGSAMYTTCWVPLTDACPENSCLYVVPRWADPGYYAGDDDDGPDPLSVALPGKEAFQAIRALPAEAGSAIMFTHRIIHWGSRGRKGYHTPRLAVSWGCADDAYEPPYFNRTHLPYPPMHLRAALAAGQMLVYHERFSMIRRQLSLYYRFFMAHADEFHASFRDKVKSEFVAATKEVVEGGGVSGGGMGGMGGMKSFKKQKVAAAAGTVEAQCRKAGEVARGEREQRNGKGQEEVEGAGKQQPKTKTRTKVEKDDTAENGTVEKKEKKKKKREKKEEEDVEDLAVKDVKNQKDKKALLKTKTMTKKRAEDTGGVTDELTTEFEGGKVAKKPRRGDIASAGVEGSLSGKKKQTSAATCAATCAAAVTTNGTKGKLSRAAAAAALSDGESDDDGDHDDDDIADEEDADEDGELLEEMALEALLDQEVGGRGAVHDDFDEMMSAGGEEGEEEEDREVEVEEEEEEGEEGGEEEEEEEGPGWEGLLGDGGCGDSEEEVMEDALDAMLDAKLSGVAGRQLRDDFDDDDDEEEE